MTTTTSSPTRDSCTRFRPCPDPGISPGPSSGSWTSGLRRSSGSTTSFSSHFRCSASRRPDLPVRHKLVETLMNLNSNEAALELSLKVIFSWALFCLKSNVTFSKMQSSQTFCNQFFSPSFTRQVPEYPELVE